MVRRGGASLRGNLGLVVAAALLVVPPVQADSPSPESHYYSRTFVAHLDPTALTVVVVPPLYVSGSQPVLDGPTQAVLEAIAYWDWMKEQGSTLHPQLDHIAWTTRVLGVDATPEDLASADIVVATAMVVRSIGNLGHYYHGRGQPLQVWAEFVEGEAALEPMTHCAVILPWIGRDASDVSLHRLRNFAVHEFGHCIGVGHTGEDDHGTADARVCPAGHPCYPAPNAGTLTEDAMSHVHGVTRQCLSNLNVASLALRYVHLPGPYATQSGGVFMPQSEYAQACMPSALARY
jgi:hypothetical protein